MSQVGFVGATGLMGHGIAKNVVTKGHGLAFTLRSENDKVADLVAAGATRVADAAELGRTSDVVILCVTASTDVEEVVLGANGLLTDPRAGLIIMDTSTSEPGSTIRLAAACAEKGVRLVDAPLTLGPQQAEDGTLNVIVGADQATFDELKPLIETFAKNIFHAGDVGSGHVVKLLNNFAFQAVCTSMAELYAVGAKAGANLQTVFDVITAGTMDSLAIRTISKTLQGQYDSMSFVLNNARKDMRYYTRLAGENAVVVPVGDGVHQALGLACNLGFGEAFIPSLVQAQEKLNDVEIRV